MNDKPAIKPATEMVTAQAAVYRAQDRRARGTGETAAGCCARTAVSFDHLITSRPILGVSIINIAQSRFSARTGRIATFLLVPVVLD
jgi:hypothetical protein